MCMLAAMRSFGTISPLATVFAWVTGASVSGFHTSVKHYASRGGLLRVKLHPVSVRNNNAENSRRSCRLYSRKPPDGEAFFAPIPGRSEAGTPDARENVQTGGQF